MNFISLFSGIGGFDLGMERAGMTCRAQVEIDKAARGVLAHHWPDVERVEDVTKAGKHNLPAVELICGGFPCQDVSIAGRRAGLDGERSGLWFEFARIVDELKPQWVLIENVPGLLSSNGGRDFKVILDGLVKCGYGVCWRVLDAQYFGLAQRRKRLFIVASLGNGRSAQVLFERDSSGGDTPKGEQARQELARDIAATLRSRGENTGTRSDFEVGLAVVGTLTGVRRLTPIECERLQGFPDSWTAVSSGKPQSDSARYKQLGNAVAVPVAEWIARRIVGVS